MVEMKTAWKTIIARALQAYAKGRGIETAMPGPSGIVVEKPPKAELGDLGFPMFPYAKLLRSGPPVVAQGLAALVAADPEAAGLGIATAEGPYLNVRLARGPVAAAAISSAEASSWGKSQCLAGHKILVEFSSPNTNKPLHLGHLRNNILGESLSRILRAAGAEVRSYNHINDSGIHICKSMLAYMKYGEGRTPKDEGLKGDHFVGKYYVLFNKYKEEVAGAEEEAQELLRKWEIGDEATVRLWKSMNSWVMDGVRETYARTGISFTDYDFQSELYESGRQEVLRGLEAGVFYREEDGSVWANLEDIGLDRKVVLRKDGTSLYVTQDIGTALERHASWPYDRLVYVVGNEQQYHFKVLFEILKRLGYDWASDLHHLSYGMVNLPSGRMKTREGTVVDADDLVNEVAALAKAEIEAKGREDAVGDLGAVAEKIALGAIHYYLLQVATTKDMLFDSEASLAFNGDTGPYIQYMGARSSSIIRKHEAGEGNAVKGKADPSKLQGDADWAVVRLIASFPEALDQAASDMDPSIIAAYLHELAAGFSTWYRENPVLNCPDFDLAASRLELVRAVKSTLRRGCELVNIPFLEAM